MHIQACTLIHNLARKIEDAKRVAWNEFQQHCTLSSLPPLLPLCTADAPRGLLQTGCNSSYLSSGRKHLWAGNLSSTWFARKQEQESQNKAQGTSTPATTALRDLLTQQWSFASSLLHTEPGESIQRTWPRQQRGLEHTTGLMTLTTVP